MYTGAHIQNIFYGGAFVLRPTLFIRFLFDRYDYNLPLNSLPQVLKSIVKDQRGSLMSDRQFGTDFSHALFLEGVPRPSKLKSHIHPHYH